MITVQQEHLEQIYIHAQKTYPQECCGLLLGKMNNDNKIVVQVWETENVWNQDAAQSFQEITGTVRQFSKNNNFSIAPEAMLKAQKYAFQQQLAIIGIYHSHPDYLPIPSEFDRQIAWQQYSYLIVSVIQEKAGELRSWILNDEHQFTEEEIIVAN